MDVDSVIAGITQKTAAEIEQMKKDIEQQDEDAIKKAFGVRASGVWWSLTELNGPLQEKIIRLEDLEDEQEEEEQAEV